MDEVCVPKPPPVDLAVFKFATSVQLDPSQLSVFAVKGPPGSPENASPAA